jgi:DNA-binding NtrC family response regulator
MAISLKRLNRGDGDKTVAITVGIDTLNLTYNREKYTPKLERELRERMEERRPGAMLADFLLNLLTGWDVVELVEGQDEKIAKLTEKVGKELSIDELQAAGIEFTPLPLNAETFEALVSVEAQALIVEKLSEDQRPNAKPSDFTSDI